MLTGNRSDDVSYLEACLFCRAALSHIHDLQALVRQVDPHSRAIEVAGVGVEASRGLQEHRSSRIIERHDEALERTATDVAVIVEVGHRALLRGTQSDDWARHL